MDIVAQLPTEIRLRILPYTYKVQPKHLLQDIKHYKDTHDALLKLYHDYWIVEMQMVTGEEKHWLINDIFSYANHYKATMYGYVDSFYRIFMRNLQIQTMYEIHNYVRILEDKKVDTQINIMLGLFTIQERNHLMKELSSYMEV